MDTDQVITVEKAGQLVGRSGRTVRRWIESGRLPGKKVDGRWTVKRSDMTDLDMDRPSSSTRSPAVPGVELIPLEAHQSALSELVQALTNAQRESAEQRERAVKAETQLEFLRSTKPVEESPPPALAVDNGGSKRGFFGRFRPRAS